MADTNSLKLLHDTLRKYVREESEDPDTLKDCAHALFEASDTPYNKLNISIKIGADKLRQDVCDAIPQLTSDISFIAHACGAGMAQPVYENALYQLTEIISKFEGHADLKQQAVALQHLLEEMVPISIASRHSFELQRIVEDWREVVGKIVSNDYDFELEEDFRISSKPLSAHLHDMPKTLEKIGAKANEVATYVEQLLPGELKSTAENNIKEICRLAPQIKRDMQTRGVFDQINLYLQEKGSSQGRA